MTVTITHRNQIIRKEKLLFLFYTWLLIFLLRRGALRFYSRFFSNLKFPCALLTDRWRQELSSSGRHHVDKNLPPLSSISQKGKLPRSMPESGFVYATHVPHNFLYGMFYHVRTIITSVFFLSLTGTCLLHEYCKIFISLSKVTSFLSLGKITGSQFSEFPCVILDLLIIYLLNILIQIVIFFL